MLNKQRKHLSKINKKSGTVEKLNAAKKAKNDEFYTSYNDINNELVHYGKYFEGKRIICPCDWDIFKDEDVFSLTIEFNDKKEQSSWDKNYFVNKVERVTYSLWDNGNYISKEVTGDDADELLKTRVACNFLKCCRDLGEKYGAKSVTASGYDIKTGRGTMFQDVDYDKYDICTTNPPFSLFPEFIKIMIDESKKRKGTDSEFNFIIMAPFVNRVNPSVGVPLLDRDCYLGFGRHIGLSFTLPDKTSKGVVVDWITSYRDAQNEVDNYRSINGISYEIYKDDYTICQDMTMKDGTHPIRVNTVGAIPDDYYGWMFTPISILDKGSYDEFEFYITGCKKWLNTTHSELSPLAHRAHNTMYTDSKGKGGFPGVLIKRKPNSRDNVSEGINWSCWEEETDCNDIDW